MKIIQGPATANLDAPHIYIPVINIYYCWMVFQNGILKAISHWRWSL